MSRLSCAHSLIKQIKSGFFVVGLMGILMLGLYSISSIGNAAGGCSGNQWYAEYFPNTGLSGTPAFTRCENTTPDYNWGNGSPDASLAVDNFSVRWSGTPTFLAGSTTFTTVSDDGVRLYVDGTRIINNWTFHAPTTNTKARTMTAGVHPVVLEYFEGGGGSQIKLSWTPVATSTPLPQIISFTATPNSITAGASSTLAWQTQDAVSCSASNGWTGTKTLTGSENVQPTTNTTYTLTCQNSLAQTVSASVTVTVTQPVPLPQITAFSASPATITAGGISSLSWQTQDATDCSASNGWSGTKALSGSENVQLVTTTTYTLTCQNSLAQTVSASVTVTVSPPSGSTPVTYVTTEIVYGSTLIAPASSQTGDFMIAGVAAPASIAVPAGWTTIGEMGTAYGYYIGYFYRVKQAGDTSWNWSNSVATQVAVYRNVDSVSPIVASSVARYGLPDTGDVTNVVFPDLTASSNGDAAHYQNIGLGFSSFSSPVNYVERADRGDSTTAGDRMNLSTGQITGGTLVAAPADTGVYLHMIMRAAGATSTPLPQIISFTATPSTITTGESTTLAWQTQDAVSCSASNGWTGAKVLTGSENVQPTTNTTYTLTCQNSLAQTVSASVTVTVSSGGSTPVTYVTTEITYGWGGPEGIAYAPAGSQVGDLMIAGILARDIDPYTLPAGWTQIGSDVHYGFNGFPYYTAYFYRIKQAGDTSWVWNLFADTQIAVYRNVDPNAPIVDAVVLPHGEPLEPAAWSALLPNLTASSNGDAAHYQSLGQLHSIFTPPAGYTERADRADATTAGDRLNLTAGQITGGILTMTENYDNGAHLHAILRAKPN